MGKSQENEFQNRFGGVEMLLDLMEKCLAEKVLRLWRQGIRASRACSIRTSYSVRNFGQALSTLKKRQFGADIHDPSRRTSMDQCLSFPWSLRASCDFEANAKSLVASDFLPPAKCKTLRFLQRNGREPACGHRGRCDLAIRFCAATTMSLGVSRKTFSGKSKVLVFSRVGSFNVHAPRISPPTIWVISLEFHGKPSILEVDDFLGACCRKAMTPQKLWTLPSIQKHYLDF